MLVDIQNKRKEKIINVLIWEKRFENWVLYNFTKLTIVSIWMFLIFIKFYAYIPVLLFFKWQRIGKVGMNLLAYLIQNTRLVFIFIFTIYLFKFTVCQLSSWDLSIFLKRCLLIIWMLLVKCLKWIKLFVLVNSC